MNSAPSDSGNGPLHVLTGTDARFLLEAVPEAIFFLDRDNRIGLLNGEAQQLVGRTRTAIGIGFHDLMGCLTVGESTTSACPFT